MRGQFLLAIDQGTSSSRAVIYDHSVKVQASAQQEFAQIYPRPGWVEHDPEDIWSSVCAVTRQVMHDLQASASDLTAIGITNQRETTLVWDRESGQCIYNAIVWQDRRTATACERLRSDAAEPMVRAKTGLRLDPYFSATKIAWILDNVAGARDMAHRGRLAFGTIDSFLLWRLTGGRVHATDASNASRTLLFNIHSQQWDDDLLALFDIPRSMLPDVLDCAADFGETDDATVGGAVPILGIAGDQQAALIGQAGLREGMTKSTYGTGCFVIANTGKEALASQNDLLTTVASRIAGEVTYGLEGSVFVAGSAIQWLRDELKIINSASESGQIAAATGVVDDVFVVPAFAGLGAPYWEPHARGAILGLTRGRSIIRVDGGMVANEWFLQFLADILDIPVERPKNVESTVLGAAYLAGVQSGVIKSVSEIESMWQRDIVFEPSMTADRRLALLSGWATAVSRVRENSQTHA
jgi:glycerol kinase